MQMFNSSTKLACSCFLFAFVGDNIIIGTAVIVGWMFLITLFINITINSVILMIEPINTLKARYCKKKGTKREKTEEVSAVFVDSEDLNTDKKSGGSDDNDDTQKENTAIKVIN